MSTWLVLGSSPLADVAYEQACDDFSFDQTITTNAGIVLIPEPSVYFLNDQVACRVWMENAKHAAEQGTRCVTFNRAVSALAERGVDWFDEFLTMTNQPVLKFERGKYPGVGFSGCHTVAYACFAGATKVVLCGHDGYSNKGDCHNFMGDDYDSLRKSDMRCNGAVSEIITPFFRRIASNYPEVEFVQYGQPHFQVGNTNWSVKHVERKESRRDYSGERRVEGHTRKEYADVVREDSAAPLHRDGVEIDAD